MPKFNPTPEQVQAKELACTGQHLKINAFAGAGKTSTLELITEALFHKKILYLAFNKSIADESAKKFPYNVTCKTSHSLAYGAIVGQTPAFREKLKGRLNGALVAKIVGLKDGHRCAPLTFSQYGNFVLATATNYMNSGYSEFQKQFVPISKIEELAVKKKVNVSPSLYRNIYEDAQVLWSKMINPNDPAYLTHDAYLKLYALSRPALTQYDVILLDESQDSNGVLLSIVSSARAQQIYVGDKYQQIYSWRGATNAMDCITTPHTCYLSQSFRFGKNIAELASKILQGELGCSQPVQGFGGIEDRIGSVRSPDCMIFRTNAGLIGEALTPLNAGRKVCIVGDIGALIQLIDGIKELEVTGRSSHPELMDFGSYMDFLEFIETDYGKDLAVIEKLISENGHETLKRALNKVKSNTEEDSDIILTTAHKSKGREWNTVKLGGDFKKVDDLYTARLEGKTEYSINPEEFNLLYVAVTRAKKELDVSNVKYLSQFLPPPCQAEQSGG